MRPMAEAHYGGLFRRLNNAQPCVTCAKPKFLNKCLVLGLSTWTRNSSRTISTSCLVATGRCTSTGKESRTMSTNSPSKAQLRIRSWRTHYSKLTPWDASVLRSHSREASLARECKRRNFRERFNSAVPVIVWLLCSMICNALIIGFLLSLD